MSMCEALQGKFGWLAWLGESVGNDGGVQLNHEQTSGQLFRSEVAVELFPNV